VAKIDLPKNLSWRDGRPRWAPGPTVRARGWKPRDLKDEAGAWLALAPAIAAAEALNAEVRDRHAQGFKRAPKAHGAARALYSVEDLFEDLWRSPRFAAGATDDGRVRRRTLGDRTVKDYRAKAHALRDFDGELWTSPVAALTPPILHGLHDALWQAKGHHMANAMLAVLRLALSHAVRRGKGGLRHNPALSLGLEVPPPRLRVGTLAEVQALVAAADAIGLPEIGDAIYLGLFTGQRQGDRLTLQDAGERSGSRVFRQAKTGAVVEVPDAPQLAARLASSRARRAAAGITAVEIIINSRTGRPFDEHAYRKAFQAVRVAAVAGAEGREARPSLADFRDQDLRDTAVTWLARAGCTIPQIRAITGHNEATIGQVLKHYLAVDAGMAGEAIARLVTYLEGQGGGL
jgi:hypothetical protein